MTTLRNDLHYRRQLCASKKLQYILACFNVFTFLNSLISWLDKRIEKAIEIPRTRSLFIRNTEPNLLLKLLSLVNWVRFDGSDIPDFRDRVLSTSS